MSDISKIDSNFKVESNLKVSDIQFHNVLNAPFQVCGVEYEKGNFTRMPKDTAKTVSENVFHLSGLTAGGRVRFITDSPYIAIHAKFAHIGRMSNMTLTGSAGFDLYVNNTYAHTFVPKIDIKDTFEGIVGFGEKKMREITINLPTYSLVNDMFIGLSNTAELLAPKPYAISDPIVFYGSSITQGGCASRPGMIYESIISRRFNADFVNLGFSGNAKGEKEIAEYISGLKMSCFVYDYDHNAPSVEHLKNTHERMFKIIREKNPEIPIVMMSRPKFRLYGDEIERLNVIKETYNNALKSGDKNVYLIEGPKLMELAGEDGTVDGCHPNDLGFASMAKALGDLLEKIIG